MSNVESRYFVKLRGVTRGPFTIEQLRRMLARGQFSKLHQVSQDKVTWEPAEVLYPLLTKQAATTKETNTSAEVVETRTADPDEWYYAFEDQKLGPVSTDVLHKQIALGRVTASTLVWRQGMSTWVEAGSHFPVFRSELRHESRRRTRNRFGLMIVVLILVASCAGIVWYSFPSAHSPAQQLQAVISPREIRSADLTDSAVHEAVKQATGMVISHIEILRRTGERHETTLGHGTAFVVTREGIALTNRHVVADHQEWEDASPEGRKERLIRQLRLPDVEAEVNDVVRAVTESEIEAITPRLTVYFGSSAHTASVVHLSKEFDLAALKIESLSKSSSYFALSSENEIPKTTSVLALGFPGASLQPITDAEVAIVAAKQDRADLAELLYGNEDYRSDFKSSSFDFISTPGEVSVLQKEANGVFIVQHTAEIRPGNSGGPLVFRQGARAGIVFAINTLLLKDDSPVFVSFPIGQMRQELETVAKITGLEWR